MTDPLDGFPVRVRVPVAWGDMDAYAHVNNTVFFRWFETARIAYLDALGLREGPTTGGLGVILASTQCRFRRPVAYPDTVHVGARVTEIGEDRITMEYRVASEAHAAVAAEGSGVVVCYDYGRARKATLPEEVRRAIERLEAGGA